MKRETKKQAILRIFEQQGMRSLGESEIRVIERRLAEQGVEKVSRSYIARVIAEAGKPVTTVDPYQIETMVEPYRQVFAGLLRFDTLEHAERSLREIGRLYAVYKANGDQRGMSYARSLVMVGRRRALAASRRARASEVAAVKREVAQWFSVWLSAPGLFDQWLALRKASPEFQSLFGAKSPN
ncbi:MAG: DUF4385 family protein [Acidobacteriota bacterium]|nr:DUF4385 family protein [Blastocatellia bacterium]MDW8239829.1 DUF4385 family protein [Acidobacteriota bacterium]